MRTSVVAVGLVAVVSAGAALAATACSSSPPAPFGGDGAAPIDATTGNGDVDARSGDRPDTSTSLPDGGGEPDSSRAGRCTPLQGPTCDLILQDCPSGQQCVASLSTDGGATTACTQVSGTQSLTRGSPCCVGGGGDPCLKGLTCVGGDSCPDAGEPPGRCSPICCGNDDAVCGNDRDGVPGRCNLMIVGGTPTRDLYKVCSYSTVCRPLGLQPCPSGQTCLVADTSGSARCSRIFAPDGGGGAGHLQACGAANACADGLACLSIGDAGSRCEYLCYVQGTATPFDAGALSSQPGRGGCPANKPTCRGVPNLYPGWLGICD